MLKGIPIGLLAGAVLVFGLFRAVEARRGGSPAGGAVAETRAAGAAARAGEAVSPGEKELQAEKAALEAELRSLEAGISAARGGGRPAAAAAGKSYRNPWSPLSARLFRLKDRLDDLQEEDNEEFRDLVLEFMEIAKELAEEEGFRMEEFEMSPYGIPSLMLAVLEGADPPLDGEALAKAQEAVAKADGAWAELKAGREGMSELEWDRRRAGLVWSAMQEIRGGLTEEQRAWFSKGRMWSDEAVRVPSWGITGTRAEVESQLLRELAGTLQMPEGAEAPLRPLVGDFVRQYEALEAEWKAREAAGGPVSPAEKALARADLGIAIEKRIGETVTLTDEQRKSLKSLGHSWEITLRE